MSTDPHPQYCPSQARSPRIEAFVPRLRFKHISSGFNLPSCIYDLRGQNVRLFQQVCYMGQHACFSATLVYYMYTYYMCYCIKTTTTIATHICGKYVYAAATKKFLISLRSLHVPGDNEYFWHQLPLLNLRLVLIGASCNLIH